MRQLLRPSGLLVLDDFAYSETSEFTAGWFYRLLELFDSCNLLSPAPESFGRKILSAGGALSLWKDNDHEINSAAEMLRSVGERFRVLEFKQAPYLYRYMCDMVSDDERGGQIVSLSLELEKQTGAEVEHFLIGRRLVAER